LPGREICGPSRKKGGVIFPSTGTISPGGKKQARKILEQGGKRLGWKTNSKEVWVLVGARGKDV